MYKKVNPSMNAQDREKEVLQFWHDNEIFKKSLDNTANGPKFSFYDGPPTANGKPHMGHILTRVVKDIIPRYKTMKGFSVMRKAGWDTHGLPVELEVEKSLGIDGKDEIEKYGIEPFLKQCKESVWKYKELWEKMSERVGYWVDMNEPYITYDDNYIESVWWSLGQINRKNLLYKGHKIVPYCSRCGTSLSSHEVAQGYKDVEDRTIVVAFELLDCKEYVLAWTTTPWTLPSNVALCVNPNADYVLISVNDKRYWLAKELVKNHFDEYRLIKTVKGSALVGKQYKPLYAEYSNELEKNDKSQSYIIVADEFVTLQDGTGVVHIAPAYGEDDAKVAKIKDLPFLQAVNAKGEFETGKFAGLKFKDADKHIIKDIKQRGLLLKEIKYQHSYPHCWRCDTPLMYFARRSWFIAMSKLKDKLVQHNSKINWMPASIGAGRMGNFLENVVDWGVSRERYWGTPLPIWECDKCTNFVVVTSKKELIEAGGASQDIELHRPYVDNIVLNCDCGGKMHRTREVIDCWYDSGSMPFAQYHYPFENKKLFERNYPADFISEAVDQTRGWFYTLSAISTAVFDGPAFLNAVVLGHVGDKNGVKMSKHKGNVVDPWTVLDKQGADAIRWYFCINSAPHLPSRFYEEAVNEASRKFIGTLWNVYSFFVLYADIDMFNPTKCKLNYKHLTLMDKWVLSCLHNLIQKVDDGLNDYKIFETARLLLDFVDKLSNWYVRRCRERFWGASFTSDKEAAYGTLYTVLVTLSKLIAPFVPFVAESIWQNIVRLVDDKQPLSVHLASFPNVEKKLIDTTVEQNMAIVLTIVENGRSARSAANIKNRQPLAKAYISGKNINEISAEMIAVIKEELNVEGIAFVTDESEFVTYEVKPQLKTLGAKYGVKLNAIKQFLADNANKVVDFFNKNKDKTYKEKLDDTDIELTNTDVLVSVKSAQGYVSASDKGIVVALDTNLTQELIEKGFVRELTSKIQNLRKDNGYQVTDRISIVCSPSSILLPVIQKYSTQIQQDTLCDSIEYAKVKNSIALDINGQKIELLVSKI